LFNPLAKTETLDDVGNAVSSPALVISAAFGFGTPSSAALAVHEGAEHASVSPIRTKLHRKGDRLMEFLVRRVVVWNFMFCSGGIV
jgi:hypothetical protein